MTVAVDLGRQATKQTNKRTDASTDGLMDRWTDEGPTLIRNLYTFLRKKTPVKQQQKHRLRTNSSLSHYGGLIAFNWRHIFALDCAVVQKQTLNSSHGGFLTNAMHHHRETILSN